MEDYILTIPTIDPPVWKSLLMPPVSTYAQGGQALRKMGATPLTFKENIQARVEAYESGNHYLFDTWLDSCTGIVYKAETTEFKIVPNCEQLRNISKDFSKKFLSVDYSKIEGYELDSGRKLFGIKYNKSLTKAEIIEHPAWLAVMEEDKALLKTYMDIVFVEYATKYGATSHLMGFYAGGITDKMRRIDFLFDIYAKNIFSFPLNSLSSSDYYKGLLQNNQLRPVFINYLKDGSDAICNNGLNDASRFLARW